MAKIHKRDEDVYEIIASKIKKKRIESNITQAELAERSNYSHEFIRRIEAPNGKKYFSINTLVKLARALGVQPEEFMKGINNEEE